MNECSFCTKELYSHGGKCNGKYSGSPCILFERDPRGCRKYEDNIKFHIRFGSEMLEVGKLDDRWQISDINKTITVTKINKIDWSTNNRGLQGVYMWCNIWYWSDENGELLPIKPKLRLVKKGE